jgi:hypothetical protein
MEFFISKNSTTFKIVKFKPKSMKNNYLFKISMDLSGLNKGVYVVKIANSVQRIVKM